MQELVAELSHSMHDNPEEVSDDTLIHLHSIQYQDGVLHHDHVLQC